MKKILLFLVFVLAISAWARAQVLIEDFEVIKLNSLSNDPLPDDSMKIVNNPLPNGVDSSSRVLRFRRSMAGAVFAGFWSELAEKYDMTDYKYISVNIMKPRISVTKFKVEGGPGGTYELPSTNDQTKTDEWEKLNFYFPDADGEYPKLGMLLDFNDPVDLTEDIIIYVDDITLRTQETGGDSIVLEDFQTIPLNQLSNDPLPNDSLMIVANPHPDDVDSSAMVLKFRRSKDGAVFAGFWSKLPEPVDLTDNKYFLAKVLKTRISPIKFKIEGGTTTPNSFELESLDPQTKIGEWEQMVFQFPDATGEYTGIAMLLDMMDPVGLDEDIVLYVDDIILSPTATGVPTGVKPAEKLNINIFPNPVKSTLYFENLKDVDRITISNTVGQQVLVRRNISNEKASINVSFLNKGIYMISIYDKNGNSTIRKIIKE